MADPINVKTRSFGNGGRSCRIWGIKLPFTPQRPKGGKKTDSPNAQALY